jgi:hypothetical protein
MRANAWIALLLVLSPLPCAGAERATRLAALPAVDSSGGIADRALFDATIALYARAAGFDVVPEDAVLAFLRDERLRFTGGVTSATLDALRAALDVDAVLVASIDLFEPGPPPRVAWNARIVAADGRIVWAGEHALSGDDHPGVLRLGEIVVLDELVDLAVSDLLAPLARSTLTTTVALAAAPSVWEHPRELRRQRPKRVFRDPGLDRAGNAPPRVAVLPFENQSGRPDAGDVVAGLFVTGLAGRPGLVLVEPGEVREALLRGRVIQEHGLSLAQGDALRELLDVDLVVTGRVLDYADFLGAPIPHVAFAVWVLDLRKRAVVWSAYSANRGDDGVVFFDVGRVRSARALASGMVLAAATNLSRGFAARTEAR